MTKLKRCPFHGTHYLCHRWNCQRRECRSRREWAECERIWLGAQKMLNTSGNVYFLTVYLSNPPSRLLEEFELLELRTQVNRLVDTLRYHANKHKEPLMYGKIYGAKSNLASSPFELHVHAVASWLPDPVSYPTPNYPHRYKSTILEDRASALGLTIWIQKAYDAETLVKKYFPNNLRDLRYVELPPNFRRISCSRGYPDLRFKMARKKRK